MLHETVVLLSVISEPFPEVSPENRVIARSLGNGFHHLSAHYGFMQTPNVPEIMQLASTNFGVPYKPERTSYYLGRETLLASKKRGMHPLRKSLFAFISRNSRSATQYFAIPADRVVELGMQIDL